MSQCPQDSYYTTASILPGCGTVSDYGSCGRGSFPPCCPTGSTYTGHTSYGDKCSTGFSFTCTPNEPTMDFVAEINCCLGQYLPNNSPNGYCATGWCPGSTNCNSYMTNYCQGSNLTTPSCQKYCQSNIGSCDAALKTFCAEPANFTQPVCGCALPADQYALSQYTSPNGIAVPITCDLRCDATQGAVRLQGQQNCDINAICVTNVSDVKIVANEVGSGITINQDCGSGPNPTPTPPPSSNSLLQFLSTTDGKIVIGVVILVIIIIVVVLLVV